MSNMRISWPNRFGDATYTGPSGAWTTSLPPSNLGTKQIAQVARSIGLTNAAIYIDAGSAVTVGTFAAVGHNLTTAADIRLRGYSADPKGSYWNEFVPPSIPAGATVTASTSGTYFGADGLLASNTAGTGRYAYTFLTGGACLGLLLEPSRTNNVLHSRDGSDAAWTKSNITAEKTVTGIDGVAASATRITSTGALASMKQTVTLGAATRRFSFYARRVSGTGDVNMTVNGSFVGAAALSLTTAWAQFDMTSTGANPEVGVRLVDSGDVIEVDCFQLEEGAYPSTPIHTTTGAVNRAADAVSITIPSNTAGTMLVRAERAQVPSADEDLIACGTTSTTGHGIRSTSAGNFIAYSNNASSLQWSLGSTASNSDLAFCYSYTANDIKVSADGAAVVTDTSATITAQTAIATSTRTGTYYLRLVAWWSAASSSADVLQLATDYSRASSDYDSGLVDAWPAAWVSGTTAEQRAGVVGCAVLAPAATYRYWRFDMIDAANPDGYLEVGRLFGGSAWSPTWNAVYGATLGYEDRDVVTEMDSGSEYMRSRPSPRVAQFALPALSDVETILGVLEMQRRLGTTGEVLYEWDPADTTYAPSRRFLARLRRVSPLRAAFLGRWEAEFEAKELL